MTCSENDAAGANQVRYKLDEMSDLFFWLLLSLF